MVSTNTVAVTEKLDESRKLLTPRQNRLATGGLIPTFAIGSRL